MRMGVFISETWSYSSDLDEVRERAQQAESLGFASGWVPYLPRSLDYVISSGRSCSHPLSRQVMLTINHEFSN